MQGKPIVKLMVRLPPELHEKLKESAGARYPRASLNAEIIERLSFSFQQGYQPTADALQEMEQRLTVLERAVFGED